MGALSGDVEAFYIGAYEVSVAQYRRCVVAGACTIPTDVGEGACNYRLPGLEAHPVDCVSVGQAMDYCAWIGGRLPSAREWIWAATGRDQARIYPWGDEPRPSCDLAAVTSGKVSPHNMHLTLACSRHATVPTTKLAASASRDGALHMFGNNSEWVMVDERASILGASWAEDYYVYDAEHFEWALGGEGLELTSDIGAPTVGFRCARDSPQ